jgi:hypothetical protein
MEKEEVDCFQCKYFFITWDKEFPRGCRALGFKSWEMPYRMVHQASGMNCLKFEKKDLASSLEKKDGEKGG